MGYRFQRLQPLQMGTTLGKGKPRGGMLRNLVPGSHLLLIWAVPGFMVSFQCPPGFRRWQGSHRSLPSPGVCAEAGASLCRGSSQPPVSAMRSPAEASAAHCSSCLPVPTGPCHLEATESGQGPRVCGRPGAPGWFMGSGLRTLPGTGSCKPGGSASEYARSRLQWRRMSYSDTTTWLDLKRGVQ